VEGGGEGFPRGGLGQEEVEAGGGATVTIVIGDAGDQGNKRAGDAIEHGHVAIEQDEIEPVPLEAFES